MKIKIISLIFVVAMALTAAGTTRATFSDLEVSSNNLIQAGRMDIQIGWEESLNFSYVENRAPDDNPGAIFNVTGIQPGETGEATIEIKNNGNPGFFWMVANQTGNNEHIPDDNQTRVCGPVRQFGSNQIITRVTGNGTETVNYVVESTSDNSVKFENAPEGLGEDGVVQTDVFNITLEGRANGTVYVETKSGRFIGTAMLQGEGVTVNDTSGLWKITVTEIKHVDGVTVFTVALTSDSEEGKGSPALSYVEFSFCDPIQKEGYYQLDLTSGDVHEPAPGRADSDLFLAALSHTEDEGNDVNPSLYRSKGVPEGMILEEEKFIIEDGSARVDFTVEEGHNVELALASFELVGIYKGWKDEQVAEQTLYDSRKTSFGSGAHSIEVDIPGGYYPDMFTTENNTVTSPQDNSSEKGELGENLRFILWHDNGDNILQNNETVLFNGTAHQLGETMEDGILLDMKPETFEIDPILGENSSYIGFAWKLPEDTGCNAQTDSKTFDFGFEIYQSRHSEDPYNRTMRFSDEEKTYQNFFKTGTFAECLGTGDTNQVGEEDSKGGNGKSGANRPEGKSRAEN